MRQDLPWQTEQFGEENSRIEDLDFLVLEGIKEPVEVSNAS